jgi:hypothetical protein
LYFLFIDLEKFIQDYGEDFVIKDIPLGKIVPPEVVAMLLLF